MKVQNVLPVVVSLCVIILVAILQKQSKLIAAITATMPLTVALSYWIVYASAEGEQAVVTQFSKGLLLGIIPTITFLITLWLASRSGFKLMPALLVAYAVWGIGAVALILLRRWLSF
jgi:hypothetical protein